MVERTGIALTALAAVVALAGAAASQEPNSAPMDRLQFVYGLAVEPDTDNTLLLGTKYGLLRASPNGMAEILPQPRAAVIGLIADPNAPSRLLLSGVSEAGNPTGILVSTNGDLDFSTIPGTAGEDGTVLTSLSVSRLDAAKLAGLREQIFLSKDGGQSWEELDATPERTFSVALSSTHPSRLYAASIAGVMVSDDDGASWEKRSEGEAPATAVATLSGGQVAAFLYGIGLVMADEATLDWQLAAAGFEDRYLRVLIEDAARPNRLYAVADTGAVLMSHDRGVNWISFEGSDLATRDRIAAGSALYEEYCQSCHGAGGVGESPEDPSARDEYGFKAPALNDDMHAWHHSDADLRATINDGSPRNERMAPLRDVLSENEVDEILAYIKSTWSIRSLACQGARHMSCMQH